MSGQTAIPPPALRHEVPDPLDSSRSLHSVSTSAEGRDLCLAVSRVCPLPVKPTGAPTCPGSHPGLFGLCSRSGCLQTSSHTHTLYSAQPRSSLGSEQPRSWPQRFPSPHRAHGGVQVVRRLCFSGPRHRDCSLSILKLEPNVT